jgi:hypothetical protein
MLQVMACLSEEGLDFRLALKFLLFFLRFFGAGKAQTGMAWPGLTSISPAWPGSG